MKAIRGLISSAKGYVQLRAIGLLLLAGVLAVVGAPPSWWSGRGVTNQHAADDYAPLNQGQLKNLVKGAVLELDSLLSVGAGDTLHALLDKWANPTTPPDDFAAVNLGQLKAVAKPVYDRLIAVGYTNAYPWANSANAQDDFAMANIGQAKNLFAFDVAKDTRGVGVADWWQNKYGHELPNVIDAQALAANGLPYMVNFKHGLDPNDPNSANAQRTVNGQTDGLTWLEAFAQNRLDALQPLATDAVEVSLYSSVTPTYGFTEGLTLSYETVTTPFNKSGTGSYYNAVTDDDGNVIFSVSYNDVLNYDEITNIDQTPDYHQDKLTLASPSETLWITNWQDHVSQVLDASNKPVTDGDGKPVLHGKWSGEYNNKVPIYIDGTTFINGVSVWNDRLDSLPDSAPDVSPFMGKYQGGETYSFTDAPDNGESGGIQITKSQFEGLRGLWQNIEAGGLNSEGTREQYDPIGRGRSAGAGQQLAFWLKTDNGQPAANDIKRTYLKVTTGGSNSSAPTVEAKQFTIPKGKITSEIVLLEPDSGQTQRLVPMATIQVDSFIPQLYINAPFGTFTHPASNIYAGDSRKKPLDASLNTGTAIYDKALLFRVRQTVDVTYIQQADPDGSKNTATKNTTVGPSRQYDSSAINRYGQFPCSKPIAVETAVPTIDEVIVKHPSEREVTAEFKVEASDPLARGSSNGPLYYHITVTLDYTDILHPKYGITGDHKLFPAYEVYIDKQLVHDYSPIPGGNGMGGLLGPSRNLVQKSITNGTTIATSGSIAP